MPHSPERGTLGLALPLMDVLRVGRLPCRQCGGANSTPTHPTIPEHSVIRGDHFTYFLFPSLAVVRAKPPASHKVGRSVANQPYLPVQLRRTDSLRVPVPLDGCSASQGVRWAGEERLVWVRNATSHRHPRRRQILRPLP